MPEEKQKSAVSELKVHMSLEEAMRKVQEEQLLCGEKGHPGARPQGLEYFHGVLRALEYCPSCNSLYHRGQTASERKRFNETMQKRIY